MATIPTPAEELANSKVHPVARRIWEEALGQPEFADVGVIWAYSASTASDHRNGRCADFMVTHTKRTLTAAERVAMGYRIRAYFVKHAARLHVQGIIWNHDVTGFPIGGGTTQPDVTYRGPAGTARAYSGADQHTDHAHVQVSGEPVTSWLKPAVYLPTYLVDPAKVSTTLQGLDAETGATKFERPAGFPITTAVEIINKWGRRWVRTQADTLYALDFLVLKSEFDARPAPTPAPAEETIVASFRVATFNVLGKDNVPEGDFATRRDRIVAALLASKASVLFLQECTATAIAAIQDKMGPDWIWDRQGARVVLVNKTVWTMGTTSRLELPTPYSKTDKSIPIVPLTHRKSGWSSDFTSVHFSSTRKYVEDGRATEEQMGEERVLQAKFLNAHFTGLGGGDLNSTSKATGKPKWTLRQKFRLLTDDSDFASRNVDSFDNSTPGGQQLDEIFASPGIEIVGGAIVDANLRDGSDHELMWADLKVKSA